ncbi:2TM domain-containing protein [Ramlibacter sp. PS4R-6]|uniref:2TM domain-containing protein n=1 Tax=Ramlibacter sp. PS4R-6 TaxID=3133438 RepID=UPI0030A531B7
MPAPQLSPEEIERLAHKRASAKMGWYIHACVYICVNGLFLARGLFVDGARPWNIYPAMGWGLGLALHFLSVFVLGKGSGLRQQLVEREREKILREQNRP